MKEKFQNSHYLSIAIGITSLMVLIIIFVNLLSDQTKPDSSKAKSNLIKWETIYKIQKPLLDPSNFWIVAENRAIVNDLGNREYPIYKIDFIEKRIVSKARGGRGPGEVSSGYKRITTFSDKNILLWDAGLVKSFVFSKKMDFITPVKDKSVKAALFHMGLVNDSTVFVVHRGLEKFLEVYRLKNQSILKDDPLWSINVDDYEYFQSLNNYLQKQGIYFDHDSESGNTYLGFKFSSLLICINEKGIKFHTLGPPNYPVVSVNTEKEGYHIPDSGIHPQGIMDVSVDGDFVYLLYADETPSFLEAAFHTFNIADLIAKINHSNKVLIYQKQNGKYVKTITLPTYAKKLEVYNGSFYLLSSLDDNGIPTISKHEMKQ